MSKPKTLLPGATIGILGGGQLGRMVCMEARRMGYRTGILDPDPDCPAGQVSNWQIIAPYDDLDAACDLAHRSDVVTYEFENVSALAVEAAEQSGAVYPSSKVLRIAQHRIREKQALRDNGFPVPPFTPVDTRDDLESAMSETGLPGVLKTATSGYDGKGQAVIRSVEKAYEAYEILRPRSDVLIFEAFVPFAKELSVICARDGEGESKCFPVQENIHVDGILDVTIAPARVPDQVAASAIDLVTSVAEKLDVVGLLAVELFLTEDGNLLINELAPRPHNSGHYTLDACVTSQFEQLLRVVCGLSLGETELMSPVAMANLLGDVWQDTCGQPDFAATMDVPGVRLHLYGKAEARPGRKMGHICVLAQNVEAALTGALTARKLAAGHSDG